MLIALLLFATPIPLVWLLSPHVAHWTYAVVASYSLFMSTLALSVLAYRLSPFHPLARYPGPLLGRVSKWWMVWETRGGQQHHWYKSMHDRYGDVVRTGKFLASVAELALTFLQDQTISPFVMSLLSPP